MSRTGHGTIGSYGFPDTPPEPSYRFGMSKFDRWADRFFEWWATTGDMKAFVLIPFLCVVFVTHYCYYHLTKEQHQAHNAVRRLAGLQGYHPWWWSVEHER